MANSKYASSYHHLKQARTNAEEQALRVNTAYVRCPKTNLMARAAIQDIGKKLLEIDQLIETVLKHFDTEIAAEEAKAKDTKNEHTGSSQAASGTGKR